ncbi:hypothetical protein [Spiroplasma taiwanense]|uniref:hypothetical protein n=1 Tax=Spiroplasma taiwanense TaxID=2145 RepID=UPI00040F4ED2|nr:hypothetical protein [Spiroplasma taiwanense]
MAIEARMERNKALHEKIKKEIIYKRTIQDEKSIINSTFEKLKQIDLNFFKEKLDIFDKKHQIEKPYLDKDKSNTLFPEELKYDIKREISELKKIKLVEPLQENHDDEEEKIYFKNEKYARYFNELQKNELNFQKNISKLKEKQSKKNIINNDDIPMTIVQQIRSKDNRTTHQMLVEVQDKVEKSQNRLLKTWKGYDSKFRFKWANFILIILILIMLVSIILPIFI